MFSLLKTFHWRGLVLVEGAPFLAAFMVAEQFYKFRSFTLEALAFMATWITLAALAHVVLPRSLKPVARTDPTHDA